MLEIANKGTLFLDEVGKMPKSRQAKLLRVIESQRFARLGGSEEISANVRWISASNEDLEDKIAGGEFLEDLFHRLNSHTLWVPPLRARLDDLPELSHYLLGRFSTHDASPPKRCSSEALAALAQYDWPGNVRELDNALKVASILSPGELIDANVIERVLDTRTGRRPRPAVPVSPVAPTARDSALANLFSEDFEGTLEQAEAVFKRVFVERALAREMGNKSRAAQRLGIGRQTLYRLLGESHPERTDEDE
jgi:DNA-binding NtrC family response regulator